MIRPVRRNKLRSAAIAVLALIIVTIVIAVVMPESNPYSRAITKAEERTERLSTEADKTCPDAQSEPWFQDAESELSRTLGRIQRKLEDTQSIDPSMDVRELPGVALSIDDAVDAYERELRAKGCVR